MDAFHLTKSKEVKVQITKIGAGLARARAGAEEKRAALALAQRELDLATSQEVQAKKDGERLTLQLGEHEAFALSTKGEAKKIKDQRDKVANEVKDHWAKVAVATLRLPVTLKSEDSGWTSEPVDKVSEQRDKLARSIRRTGELAKQEDENANVRRARQELESLTFRDPDSQVGNLNHNIY